MSLGKFILLFFLVTGISNVASAQQKSARTIKKFSVGAGLMTFGEPLQITDSSQKDNGFASYSGFVLLADHTWTKNRWVYQFGGGVGSGKASAGGFVNISYPDSGRRTWTFPFLEFAAHFRINPRISFGGGMMAGNRSADWKSEANPAVKTKQLNKVIYAPEFVIRIAASRKLTFIQSLASPDFRGNTIWRWSLNFSL